jgi:hypothetical protein
MIQLYQKYNKSSFHQFPFLLDVNSLQIFKTAELNFWVIIFRLDLYNAYLIAPVLFHIVINGTIQMEMRFNTIHLVDALEMHQVNQSL